MTEGHTTPLEVEYVSNHKKRTLSACYTEIDMFCPPSTPHPLGNNTISCPSHLWVLFIAPVDAVEPVPVDLEVGFGGGSQPDRMLDIIEACRYV